MLESRAEVQRVYEGHGVTGHRGTRRRKAPGPVPGRAVPGEGPRSGGGAPEKDPGRTQRSAVRTRGA